MQQCHAQLQAHLLHGDVVELDLEGALQQPAAVAVGELRVRESQVGLLHVLAALREQTCHARLLELQQGQRHLQIERGRRALRRCAAHQLVPDEHQAAERQCAHPELEEPAGRDLQQRASQPAEAEQPVCKLHEHLHLYPEADKLQRRARVELRRKLSEQRHKHPERTLLVAIEQQEQRRSHEVHGLHVANLRIIDCPGAEYALELGEVRRFIEVRGVRLKEVGARPPNVLADVGALTVVDFQLGAAAEAFIRGGRCVLSLPPP